MFDYMVIAECIYEGVVEPSYEKPTRSYLNRASHIRQKRVENALSKTYSAMGKSSGKCRK